MFDIGSRIAEIEGKVAKSVVNGFRPFAVTVQKQITADIIGIFFRSLHGWYGD